MPGGGIIIISGGTGNKSATVVGVGYPVAVGDAIENEDSVTREVTFVNYAMQTTDLFIAPGNKHTFVAAGAITVQP
jgi:hypothetical protein